MRQNDLAFEVQAYLKSHPCAAVVNLGCGLDNTGRACDNGRCKIYNLDFPDVIALRQQLLPAGEREQNIPCDLKDPAWFDKIDASGGAVFFASGVFYYFLTEQVRELVQGMADAFPCGVLVFDPQTILLDLRSPVSPRKQSDILSGAQQISCQIAPQNGENQGCGSIFRDFGCEKRAFPMGQPFASIQQGLYEGLQRPERPFRQRLFPVSCKGR